MLNSDPDPGMTAVGLVLLENVVVPAVVSASNEPSAAAAFLSGSSVAAKPGWKAGLPAKKPPTKSNPHMPAMSTPENAGRRSIAAHKRCSHGDCVMASSNVSKRAVSPARNRAVT